MGRKQLITDSYPVVKRGEGPAGHCKGELARELGEEPRPPGGEDAEEGFGHRLRSSVVAGEEPRPPGGEDAVLELLRQFDLAWQYGPCTGITRLQRWHRAEQMGLDPPPEVLQLLKAHPGDPRFQYSLWHLYPL